MGPIWKRSSISDRPTRPNATVNFAFTVETIDFISSKVSVIIKPATPSPAKMILDVRNMAVYDKSQTSPTCAKGMRKVYFRWPGLKFECEIHRVFSILETQVFTLGSVCSAFGNFLYFFITNIRSLEKFIVPPLLLKSK